MPRTGEPCPIPRHVKYVGHTGSRQTLETSGHHHSSSRSTRGIGPHDHTGHRNASPSRTGSNQSRRTVYSGDEPLPLSGGAGYLSPSHRNLSLSRLPIMELLALFGQGNSWVLDPSPPFLSPDERKRAAG